MLRHALSEVTKIYPPLKQRVSVDDITGILKGRNEELAELAHFSFFENVKEEAEKKG